MGPIGSIGPAEQVQHWTPEQLNAVSSHHSIHSSLDQLMINLFFAFALPALAVRSLQTLHSFQNEAQKAIKEMNINNRKGFLYFLRASPKPKPQPWAQALWGRPLGLGGSTSETLDLSYKRAQ